MSFLFEEWYLVNYFFRGSRPRQRWWTFYKGILGSLKIILVNPSWFQGVLGVLSFPFYLSGKSKHNAITLMHELARVWQLTPTQKNLVPRFRICWEEGGGTWVEDDPPFPKWLPFRNGVTIEPWETWYYDVEWYAQLDQGYERGTLDTWDYLEDQAFRGPLHG